MTTTYQIYTKKPGGKWSLRSERPELDAAREEWAHRCKEMPTRPVDGRRRLRLARVENGVRTIMAQYTPNMED